jgi:hypothetical protein
LIYGLTLGATLFAAWLLQNGPAPAPDIQPARRTLQPQALLAQHAGNVSAWAATSLARPLFSRGRRPPPPPEAIAAAAPPELPPRLTAVLVGPFGNSAVFVPSGSDQSIVVQEGGRVGPYRIRRIAPGKVLVEAPDGEHVLRPGFRSRVDAPPAPEQRAASAVSRYAAAQQPAPEQRAAEPAAARRVAALP